MSRTKNLVAVKINSVLGWFIFVFVFVFDLLFLHSTALQSKTQFSSQTDYFGVTFNLLLYNSSYQNSSFEAMQLLRVF